MIRNLHGGGGGGFGRGGGAGGGPGGFGMLAIDMSKPFKSGSVLLVNDMLHPINSLTLQRLLNGDMRHRCRGCGSMPMLLSSGKPDHIARPDFLNRTLPHCAHPRPEITIKVWPSG